MLSFLIMITIGISLYYSYQDDYIKSLFIFFLGNTIIFLLGKKEIIEVLIGIYFAFEFIFFFKKKKKIVEKQIKEKLKNENKMEVLEILLENK